MYRLIGARLVSIDDEKIVVEKYGETCTIEIVQDEGRCCGFNEVETTFLLDEKNSPAIVRVESTRVDRGRDEDMMVLTFFGVSGPIAKLESTSFSGSGYGYGANVKLICDRLCFNKTITRW